VVALEKGAVSLDGGLIRVPQAYSMLMCGWDWDTWQLSQFEGLPIPRVCGGGGGCAGGGMPLGAVPVL